MDELILAIARIGDRIEAICDSLEAYDDRPAGLTDLRIITKQIDDVLARAKELTDDR
jgi:hypothetical protein